MRSPSKTICFCRIWGDFIIVIHGVTFESQSPQTRMITDFFLVLSVLNEQHFFNQMYSKDISRKSGSVLREKIKRGEFIGGYASYGYIKDPEDRHRIIVDPEAAEVVRSIFQKKLEGAGTTAITRWLNDSGVLSPCC